MFNNKNYAIMEKVYLIALFNAKTKKYLATYNEVYASKEIAQLAINNFKNPNLTFTIIKVNMIKDKDFLK